MTIIAYYTGYITGNCPDCVTKSVTLKGCKPDAITKIVTGTAIAYIIIVVQLLVGTYFA